MLLQANSLLNYAIVIWPFAMAVAFAIIYWRQLNMQKRITILVVGPVLGYGVQVAIAYPLYLWIVAAGKSVDEKFRFGPVAELCVMYGCAIFISATLLWLVIRLLRNNTDKRERCNAIVRLFHRKLAADSSDSWRSGSKPSERPRRTFVISVLVIAPGEATRVVELPS